MIAKSHIRLLILYPGSRGEPIKCELVEISLDERAIREYEALSYVWGPRAKDHTVLVDKAHRPVTDNLHDALQRLRYEDNKRTLWTDQLCIDQWDIEEKSHQVSLMSRIYSCCKKCLIWVGEYEHAVPPLTQSLARSATDAVVSCAMSSARAKLTREPYAQETLEATGMFIVACEHWWSRIWTLQEVVLPPAACIVWGDQLIPWKVMEDLPDQTHKCAFLFVNYYTRANFYAVVRGISMMRHAARERPMQALQRHRHRDALDPRDKIYSLMGLYPRSPWPGVPTCDYTTETHQLFKIVTIDLIATTDSLTPLTGQRGEPHMTEGLPSWALDFVPHSDPWKRNARFDRSMRRYNWYNANAGRALRWSNWNNENYSSVLRLDALQVDRITAVGEVCRARSDRRDNILDESDDAIRRTIDSWEDMVRTRVKATGAPKYPLGNDDWETSFCKTILGDMIWNYDPKRTFRPRDVDTIKGYRERRETQRNEARASIIDMVVKRGFFLTHKGYLGIGPPNVQPGDEAWLFAGCRVPLIIRPQDPDAGVKEFTFVGDAFVHGTMWGHFAKAHGDEWRTVLIH